MLAMQSVTAEPRSATPTLQPVRFSGRVYTGKRRPPYAGRKSGDIHIIIPPPPDEESRCDNLEAEIFAAGKWIPLGLRGVPDSIYMVRRHMPTWTAFNIQALAWVLREWGVPETRIDWSGQCFHLGVPYNHMSISHVANTCHWWGYEGGSQFWRPSVQRRRRRERRGLGLPN